MLVATRCIRSADHSRIVAREGATFSFFLLPCDASGAKQLDVAFAAALRGPESRRGGRGAAGGRRIGLEEIMTMTRPAPALRMGYGWSLNSVATSSHTPSATCLPNLTLWLIHQSR